MGTTILTKYYNVLSILDVILMSALFFYIGWIYVIPFYVLFIAKVNPYKKVAYTISYYKYMEEIAISYMLTEDKDGTDYQEDVEEQGNQ